MSNWLHVVTKLIQLCRRCAPPKSFTGSQTCSSCDSLFVPSIAYAWSCPSTNVCGRCGRGVGGGRGNTWRVMGGACTDVCSSLRGGNADWPDKCTHHQHAAIIYIYNIHVGSLCESTVQYMYYMCQSLAIIYMCILILLVTQHNSMHAYTYVYTQQGSCMGWMHGKI